MEGVGTEKRFCHNKLSDEERARLEGKGSKTCEHRNEVVELMGCRAGGRHFICVRAEKKFRLYLFREAESYLAFRGQGCASGGGKRRGMAPYQGGVPGAERSLLKPTGEKKLAQFPARGTDYPGPLVEEKFPHQEPRSRGFYSGLSREGGVHLLLL